MDSERMSQGGADYVDDSKLDWSVTARYDFLYVLS